MFGATSQGEQASVEFYEKWVEEVKASVPKERLLVFNVKQGWKPLCDFLGVPVPNDKFPNVNDTKQVQERVKKIRILSKQKRKMIFWLNT